MLFNSSLSERKVLHFLWYACSCLLRTSNLKEQYSFQVAFHRIIWQQLRACSVLLWEGMLLAAVTISSDQPA